MSFLPGKKINYITINPDQLHRSFNINADLAFINFIDLNEREALEVLDWRNHPKIRQVMFTQQLISAKDHLNFIANLPNQRKRFYWVVKEGEKCLGVVDIVNYKGLECEWGFYLNPNLFGKGLAVNLLFHALNFFFKELKLKKLYGYCYYKNTKALLFHDIFNIVHVKYEKCHISDRKEWHSRREILGINWINNKRSISDIKANLKKEYGIMSLEWRKNQFDQLFLDTYKQPPYLFYRTHLEPRLLPDQVDKFELLLKRIEVTFGKKISRFQAVGILYYMDALKFCL